MLLDHCSRSDRSFGCVILVQDIAVLGCVIILQRDTGLGDAELEECWIICRKERSLYCACLVEVRFGLAWLGESSMKTNERRRRTCRGK